jgi:hypothetical protein
MTGAESLRRETADERHYLYPPTSEQFPSVTTVLSATDGKPWLVNWSARLAAEYCVANLNGLARVKVCKDPEAAIALIKDRARQIRELKADAGSYVHKVVEALILWAAHEGDGENIAIPGLPEHLAGADYDDDPLENVVKWMIDGFINFTAAFRPEFEAAEMAVFHPALKVAGTLDMIVVLYGVAIGPSGRLVPAPGHRLVLCIDVKTGKHLDVTVPEQLAGYRRMTQAMMPFGDLVDMPPTDGAAVLHLRPEHQDGYRLMLVSGADDAAAWNRFRRALELWHGRRAVRAKPGKVVYALQDDGTMPPVRLADLDGEGYGRALNVLIKAGVTDLEQLALLQADDLLTVKGIGGKTLDVIRVMLADHGLHLHGEELPPDMKAVA